MLTHSTYFMIIKGRSWLALREESSNGEYLAGEILDNAISEVRKHRLLN